MSSFKSPKQGYVITTMHFLLFLYAKIGFEHHKFFLFQILKPAFTIIYEMNTQILDDGGISNLVLGYAHCGMVAGARWIAKLSSPTLLKAVEQYPDYEVKVVGHSLGGGTAALLTYILREQMEFSAATCVTFAPAACMT
ncbi:hypothetical protein ACS0TY_023549 [Phlomoides rotata]